MPSLIAIGGSFLVTLLIALFRDHTKLSNIETLIGNHLDHRLASIEERLGRIEDHLMGK